MVTMFNGDKIKILKNVWKWKNQKNQKFTRNFIKMTPKWAKNVQIEAQMQIKKKIKNV